MQPTTTGKDPLPSPPARSVQIAIPCYGGQIYGLFASSLLQYTHHLTQKGIEWNIHWQWGESHVGRARNTAAGVFLESGRALLQFLDADLVFDGGVLAAHNAAVLEGEAPVGAITGGSYPLKRLHPEQIAAAVRAGVPPKDILDHGLRQTIRLPPVDRTPGSLGEALEQDTLVETLYTPSATWLKCLYLPTGLMTVPRAVVQALATPERLYYEGSDTRYDLFGTSISEVPGRRTLLSEDYHFCELASRVGVESWCNTGLNAAHLGLYRYG